MGHTRQRPTGELGGNGQDLVALEHNSIKGENEGICIRPAHRACKLLEFTRESL